MASNCKAFRAEIEGASGGWLSRAAQAHLNACAACLNFFDEHDALRRLVGELERVEAPADFDFRLRARMAAANETRASRFSIMRFVPSFVPVALTAIMALSVAAVFYLGRTPVEYQTSVVPTASRSVTVAESGSQSRSIVEVGDKSTMEEQQVKQVVMASAPPLRRRRAAPRLKGHAPDLSGTRQVGVMDSAYSAAPIIKPSNLKLNVSAEPLHVVLRDETGAPRRLAMKSVSFGAQNLVGRASELANASLADNEGVW